MDAYFGRFHLDVYLWMSDLDVLAPGTSSTRDPDALTDILLISTIFSVNVSLKNFVQYLKLVRVPS